MLQRLIAAVLGVLGVAAIGLGVASATVWRADDPLVATAEPGGDTRTLVTDPGVLELAGDPVTVTVRAEGAPVVLAVGRDSDVTAWVGSDPYARVTGLSDWHTLATTAGEDPAATPDPSATATEEADAAAAPSPSASGGATDGAATAADPTGNDMWVVEVTGDETATLEWPAQEGRWSLLAVSLGDAAPVLDLSWPQTVTTPWLWPGVALGVLLLAVAAVLLVRILRQRREGPDAGWTDVSTGTLATVPLPATAGSPGVGMPAGAVPVGTVTPGAPLTRRQLREAEAAAAAARKRGGTPTGSVPVVTGATPAVTGATPAVGAAAPGPDGRPTTPGSAPAQPPASAQPASSAGTGAPARPEASARPGTSVPSTVSAPPTPSTRPDPTGARAADGAPASAAPPAPVGAAPAPEDAETGPRARRLADRLPWRRGRAGDEPTAPATGEEAAPAARASWSPDSGAGQRPGPAPTPTTTGPVPGTSTGARSATGPATTGTPVAPTTAPRTPPAPAPGAPAGAPTGSTSAGPTAGAPAGATPDEDAAGRAQRADAWRRMWGFPSAEEGAAPARQDDDTPEEGR